ncbi:hypothetical protein H2199_000144 [Coniosporium tulheliwenetii]|uniref:Uncharacterized protein n=1 Tax=Coniosporium tulheliwenetii TaxID=3383036 RepID=A0ACC2ZPI3_9PEZI|nr:hypothetical protein H2199_000144 [Cladosporium sp. JES 115]
MVASWNIGCFISAILAIWLGDILGRRKTIFVGLFIMGIGEIIQASSYSLGQFIAGRVIAGFGNGFNTSTIPAWHAECCKAHRKGTVLMISAGSSIALGVALSQWIGFGFAYLEPSSASWRVPIAIQLVLPVIILAVIMLLPESPRWLILKGREDEALNALAALNDLPRNDPEVFSEFIAIKDAVLQMAAASPSGLFKMNEYRDAHRTVLAYCIQIFQQATGINLIVQYIALILLQQTRYSGWVARLLAACNGTEFFLASFIAVVGIDRFWGRRSLMMFGASGMCISMIIITVLRYLDNRGENIAATVVVLITPIAFNNIGYRTYIIFAAFNAAIVPLVYFFYPETAYRSLEEVDAIFYAVAKSPRPWLSAVSIAREHPLWYGKNGEGMAEYEQSEWHQRIMQTQKEKPSEDSAFSSSSGAIILRRQSGGTWARLSDGVKDVL